MSNDDKLNPMNNKVGGYDVANLFSGNTFFSNKNKVPTFSFKIQDIAEIQGDEILKLKFSNTALVRVMKYANENNQPIAIFDIVDEEKKQIVVNTDKEFIGGLGISPILYEMNFITQWEIPILEKLFRAFVLGDPEALRVLIKDYHVEISSESEWRLRHKLGL